MADNQEIYSDLAIHPGETLADAIEEHDLTQAKLAQLMGRPPQVINEIVRGKKDITPATALELEPVFGVPASFWNNMQARYEFTLARNEQRKRLGAQTHLLKHFKYNELVKRGWIEPVKGKIEQVKALCAYLGVASLNQHQAILPAAFRITGPANFSDRALASWLRRGDLLARDMDLPPFNRERFRSVLPEVRTLTEELPDVFHTKMVKLCASAGVGLAVVKELPKAGAVGVTRWLGNGNPLIQLNLKHKWADVFWFTFFHEAGHVLQPKQHEVAHYTRRRDAADLPYEAEANDFAQDILIPRHDWRYIRDELITYRSSARVEALAQGVGIHPGIIVGRLQYERVIPYSQMNELREQFEWSE